MESQCGSCFKQSEKNYIAEHQWSLRIYPNGKYEKKKIGEMIKGEAVAEGTMHAKK